MHENSISGENTSSQGPQGANMGMEIEVDTTTPLGIWVGKNTMEHALGRGVSKGLVTSKGSPAVGQSGPKDKEISNWITIDNQHVKGEYRTHAMASLKNNTKK